MVPPIHPVSLQGPKVQNDAILATTNEVANQPIDLDSFPPEPPPIPSSSTLNSTSTSISIPPSMHNFSQELLTPWSSQGMKIFLDICSGSERPLSKAIEDLGLPALSIDILLGQRMDLLDDTFCEQLLRLCGSGVVGYSSASPSCTEYSLLKLKPGGPRAIRTPDMLDGLPDLSPQEQQRLQDSATMLDRSIQAVSCTFTAGGHGHLEQPSGAMSWREPCTQQWLRLGSCSLILLAACAFDWDIKKTWLFASSFTPLAAIASICTHPAGSHQSIAGVRDEHGIYLSRRSATYPAKLAQDFAQKVSVLLSPAQESLNWNTVFSFFPKKDWFADPKSFVDGGGLFSSPDWSKPPDLDNLFKPLRDHWIPKILQSGLHKQIVAHFQQHHPPFSEKLVQEFRDSLDTLIPLQHKLDWQVRADQPLCLHALSSLSDYMDDADKYLFPSLIAGVSTGFHDQIPPSNVFLPNEMLKNQINRNCLFTGQIGIQRSPNLTLLLNWFKKRFLKVGWYVLRVPWMKHVLHTLLA